MHNDFAQYSITFIKDLRSNIWNSDQTEIQINKIWFWKASAHSNIFHIVSIIGLSSILKNRFIMGLNFENLNRGVSQIVDLTKKIY